MADADTAESAPQAPEASAVGKPTAPKGKKPGMSAARRALRDTAIVSAVYAGETPSDVAKEHELTRAQVNKIVAKFDAGLTPLDDTPMEILERAIRTYQKQMKDFAALAADTVDRAPAVAVASMKGYADAFERYLSVLNRLGKLPDNLNLFRREQELYRFVDLLNEKVQLAMAGEITWEELSEFFAASSRDQPEVTTFELEAGEPEDAAVV